MAVIEPKVAGVDMFHFYQANEVIEYGAEAAKSAVEQGALDSITLKILNRFKEKISDRIAYIMKKKLLSTLFTGTLILGFLFPAVQVKNPSGMVSTYGIIDCVYDNY